MKPDEQSFELPIVWFPQTGVHNMIWEHSPLIVDGFGPTGKD
jgi:hypothetical protein